MKLIILIYIIFLLSSCNSDDAATAAGSTDTPADEPARVCDPFTLDNDLLEIVYTGTTVTTVSDCGEEYDIDIEGNYLEGASITGWRLINGVLSTNSGDINFTSGGRFMDADSAENEGMGLTFGGIDHTVCQDALGINGQQDSFVLNVTAKFNTDCNIILEGTFREYSTCTNSSEVTICSGTIILE